ncbi:hypothetical protein SAMN05216199_0606 [Pedococcus cremeus]|uniref:Uncharacterized protein n=1 Tax=Pedococcus cremeus TaxID=587636 RepID=A0A1H9XVE7_9MICO|nr:hypothetical protein [Pedococcus cremeus]SES50074.1 hypothetical protein SAMN05216199_0606 [Pedococcus cremeus]
MNVRSVSPEGGGVLLPFRGNRDDDEHRAEHDAAPPTVVHLTGRRRVPAEEDRRRRPRWQPVSVLLAAVAVVVAGAVTAALTGVLPLATERPVPRPAVSAPPTSASVENGNLPAAYGLCKAFDRAAQRGDDIATAQAFRNLAHAAGGASRVSAYCAPFQGLDPGRAG